MISWTLNKENYSYWTTTDIGEIEWGYPQDGDEVIIDDRFKYIFRVPEKIKKGLLEQVGESNTTTYNRISIDDLTTFTGLNYTEQFNQALSQAVVGAGESLDSEIVRYLSEHSSPIVERTESIDDVRITMEVYPTEETTDETTAYLQEANNLMNGR